MSAAHFLHPCVPTTNRKQRSAGRKPRQALQGLGVRQVHPPGVSARGKGLGRRTAQAYPGCFQSQFRRGQRYPPRVGRFAWGGGLWNPQPRPALGRRQGGRDQRAG